MTRNTSRELKRHVHDFMREEGILPAATSGDTLAPAFYSHVLPSVRPKTLRERRVLGANWALVGDAAGWVDPLTGEGLYYAMRSGDLLGQALVRGQPEDYLTSVRKEFCPEFEMAVRAAHRFFDGMFLGRPVIMRMIQFLQRSPTLRKITAELFSGEQDYRTLKARLVKGAGVVLAELLASMFCTRKNEQRKV
jgi:flavin-dependent dehydrogenase